MSNEIKIILSGDASGAVAAVGKLNNSLNTLPTNTRKATGAITSLSRVISDLPFGFIAIQNNLDQLGTSFQGVSAKQLVQSLIGPAGLFLAFTSVNSLITAGIQKYGSLSAAIQETFGSTSALESANRQLSKSFADASEKAGAEISTVKALVAIARDKSLADSARTEAINKLNKEYDQYLPKLSLENINTQQVTLSVDKLNQSLLRQAKIRAVQELVGSEFKKQAELALKGTQIIEDSGKGVEFLINSLIGGGNAVLGYSTRLKSVNKEYDESIKKTTRFDEVLKNLLKDEAIGGTLFDDTKIKKVKDRIQKIKEEIEKTFSPSIVKTSKQFAESIGSSLTPGQQFGLTIDTSLAVTNIGAATEAMKRFGEEVEKQAADKASNDLFLAKQEQAKDLAGVVSGTLGPAFQGLFTDIISGSQTAFSAFGQAIKQVIAKLISAAVTAAIFAAIISAAFGGTFATSFKAVFSSLSGLNLKGLIPGFANGVTNFSGGLAIVGERGPELVNLPQGADVIAGHMLNGGGQSQELFARIDNRSIYLSNKWGGIRAGRLG